MIKNMFSIECNKRQKSPQNRPYSQHVRYLLAKNKTTVVGRVCYFMFVMSLQYDCNVNVIYVCDVTAMCL